MPFYGSNGGIIEFNNNEEVKKRLINAHDDIYKRKKCIGSTLITSPFDPGLFLKTNFEYDYIDSRIGQITEMPENFDPGEALFKKYHSKTRNIIRKAIKSNISVSKEFSTTLFDFLIKTHQENIKALNGIFKPNIFFKLIKEIFEYKKDYKLFTALHNGQPISSLLVLYYNKTVEYFTPVVLKDYRNIHPLSLLIFEAMKDAIVMGYKWWNWGCTWNSQQGVYNFKKSWGTKDFPYYYYVRLTDKKILHYSKDDILEYYKNFYIVPFDKLIS